MSESTFESQIEDTMREQLAEGAGFIKAAFDGATSKRDNEEDEREGFVEAIVLAAKVRANNASRRVLRRFGPERFRTI